MKKKYKINKNKKLIKELIPYWTELLKLYHEFDSKIFKLEKQMQRKTKIKDIEFIMCDNEYVGIGE